MLPDHTKSVKFFCRIDPSAVVAILIALLSMFMADTSGHTHARFVVELPQASYSVRMPGVQREDALTVAITREGKVFLNNERINPTELTGKIEEHLRSGAERNVYIRADFRAHYREVADVLHRVREAGVEKVGLLTEQRRPEVSWPLEP
jgi:biopolymer transport protein ExbD/biopolymer transport protein TolR